MNFAHSLVGRFTPKAAGRPIKTQNPSGSDTTATAHLQTCDNEISTVSADDSVCVFNNRGIAAIAGSPRWSSDELAREAAENSHASALASAYTRHGRNFLDHVTGPFSFAIVDGDQNRMLAGIDRIGQHTLYYSKRDGNLLFGSTASSVLAQTESTVLLSEQGIYNYFYFHMVPSPQSVYQGLNKLPAAHYLEFSGGKLEIFRYWTPSFQQKSSKSFSAMGAELKNQLRGAVERSLVGTSSAGTFLSGGLDSSTVTGMLAEITDGACPAYAIGFDQEGYDEMEFARNTARHFDVNLREYYVTPQDVVDELPTIATSYDEPFGNSSALPAYFCGKRAREDGIDCLFAGDGGDEIFAGNERYAKQQTFGLYSKLPGVLRNAILEPAISLLPDSFALGNKAKSYIAQANIPLPDRLQTYNYLNRMPPSEIFADSFLRAVDIESPLRLQRQTYHSLEDTSDLNRMLYLDWQYTLADNDLRKVNRMCAIAGIGVRYPMLDEELVDFSCQLPDNWKLKRGSLRHFFKESLTGWLPEATINKKKQGFGLPFGLWMQSYKPLSEMANDSMLRLKSRGYFKAEFLDRLVDLHRDEHAAYYGELIWILTIFDLWLEGRKEPSP